MKFRISSKDLAFFGGFCALLFYLSAVATGNINSFSTDGTFCGLNPFPGMTTFIVPTLILFIILLILIFSSVQSFIFERKKGIGFEIGEKDNKGYSRWSKDKEMKSDKGVQVVDPVAQESQYAGIPLVNDGKKLWVDNGEYHNLVIGATGSGKSQTCVEPMVEILIKKGESMIITDPKGELYKAASDYMRKRGYNVIVLNFREPQRGNAWNPLTLPYRYYKEGLKDKATELLDDVALNILYDPNNKSGDPFWEKSAADYFSGLSLGLFEDADEKEINLNSINLMSTVGEDKFGSSNFVKTYFTMKGEASNAYVFASNTINSPTETKGGILSVFRQKIRLFASRENLSEMLAYSDFDMRSIGKQKTAVFICIHDEKTTYHSLATIFIKQCYETLIDVAQQNGGKLPYRTNFILDEFANMPPLKDVTTMVTAARSRDIRFTFIIQNFAQLKSVYGNEDAETIKGNCGNLIYLISTELAALEEISKMCGEVKSSEKDKTSSTPLVTVTDLQKLKLFEAIIIRWRLSPFKTKYTPNYKMNWGHEHTSADFPTRTEEPIKLFDIKEFVKKKQQEKIMNSSTDGAGKNPFENNSFGGGFGGGSNPFGGGSNPFGGGSNPFGGGSNPFGGGSNPFGGGANPFGGGSNPFGGNDMPSEDNFGGLGNFDVDAMLKDIDRKIAELDAEEERKKKEEEEAKKKENNISNTSPSLPKMDDFDSLFNDDYLGYDGKIPATNPVFKKEPSNDFESYFSPKAEAETRVVDKPQQFEMPKSSFDVPSFDDFDVKIQDDFKDIEKTTLPIANETSDFNEFDNFTRPNKINYSTGNNNEVSLNNERVGVAVATGIPAEDDFYEFDDLPKVENVDVVKPNYISGTVVKTNDDNNRNIYNTLPDVMKNISSDVKNQPQNKMDEYESLDEDLFTTLNKEEDKVNVNIEPDKIKVDNNMISDDEFFDDFFGDE